MRERREKDGLKYHPFYTNIKQEHRRKCMRSIRVDSSGGLAERAGVNALLREA